MRSLALAAGVVIALSTGAGKATACPSCGARAKEGGAGYMAATAVLVVLPFASLGGFVLWLRRQDRESLDPPDGDAPGPREP